MVGGAYTSGLSHSGVLGLLLPLFHLLSFLPLNLQQGLGDSGLLGHPPPARGLGLRLLGLLQRLLLLQLQELLLLPSALRGRCRRTCLNPPHMQSNEQTLSRVLTPPPPN